MPLFRFAAEAPHGEVLVGRRTASSRDELWDSLQAERLEVRWIRKAWWDFELRLPRRRLPLGQVEAFTRMLASLLRSLTTAQALDVLGRQLPSARLRPVVNAVRLDVHRGTPLNQALRRHPDVFDATYCAVVEQGERTGTLDQMLGHLAYMLERVGKLRSEFWKAAAYPVVVLGTVLLMTVYILVVVLPEFDQIFRQYELELPLVTTVLLDASAILSKHSTLLLVGSAVVLFGTARAVRLPGVRPRWDALLLRLPLIGRLLTGAAMASFCHYMSVSLGGGVMVVQALRMTAETQTNQAVARSLRAAAKEVAAGRGLAQALSQTRRVPALVVAIIEVGERSGELPEMLRHTAQTYEEEVLRDVQLLVRATEPLMILLLTAIVALLVSAVYSPVMKAFSSFSV